MLRVSSVLRVMKMRRALGQDPCGSPYPDKNPPRALLVAPKAKRQRARKTRPFKPPEGT
jgi:hypothetical protein